MEYAIIEIDHQVKDGMCIETIGILLTREYLDQKISNGLNIQAYGKRGNKVFTLPPFYIKGFLRKVDEFLGRKEGIL